MQSDTTAHYMIAHFLPIDIPRATLAVQNKAVPSYLNRDKDNYSSQYRDLKKSSISKIWKIVQNSTYHDRLPVLENPAGLKCWLPCIWSYHMLSSFLLTMALQRLQEWLHRQRECKLGQVIFRRNFQD